MKTPSTQPILEITEIHLALLESFPAKLRITVLGTVPSPGWSNPQLVPYTYVQAPPDGIYDFDFVATPPPDIVTKVITPIRTRTEVPAAGIKGVRIHASLNVKEALLHVADPGALIQPNLFTLQGYQTQITYATTSITGMPQFTYNDGVETLHFRGEEIVVEESQLGQMVSIVLPESRAFATLTLLVPVIHLPQECRESAIQTTAILSRRVKVKEGQAQSYQPLALAGAAQQVSF